MSLEAHHQFILNTMQRHDDIARKLIQELEAENARLKAEVERLTQNTDKLCKHGDLEIERLKAENKRLIKAGDAMASSIQFNEEMEQDYNGPTIVRQCVKDWNAAKEGKQS
jgi:uncharacterized small protein (DUF1192 family)